MSQRTPEEPKGGIPQSVADDINALASEIRAVERKAAAGWKTALAVWIILLAVIFCYLYFGVYGKLKQFATPDVIAALGMQTINGALTGQGLPALSSPDLSHKLADLLKDQAPALFEKQIKPQVQGLLNQLPEKRKELVAEVKQRAPGLIDQGIVALETDLLPKLRQEVVSWVDSRTDELLATADATIRDAVSQVVTTHKANIKDLQDPVVLRKALELAFEDAMGEVMDEMFKGLDEKVAQVREGMEKLVATYTTDPRALTSKERLEIRLIQLVEALFRGALEEAPPAGGGLTEELRQLLGDLADITDIPEAAREEIRQAVPAGREPDLSRVPEQYREQIRLRIEAARRSAPARGTPPEAMERGAEGGAVEPGATPTRRGGPPPEVQKRIEEMRRKAEEAAAAAAKAREAGQ